MSKLSVCNMQGTSVGDVELPDSLLVLDRGLQAVHDAVVQGQAHRRAGTASTKAKWAVAGSGRKPWRQKGTGRARAGYRQSPVWRGGGVAHGPHPREFGGKVNRKVAQLAFQRAMSEKVSGGGLRLVDALAVTEPRTRLFRDILKALGLKGPAMFVVDRIERNLTLAVRNLPDVELVRAADVSVYQLLRYPAVVATRAAFEILKGRMSAGKGAAA